MDALGQISVRETAHRLGTSAPRVKRAVERLGIRPEQGAGGRLCLSQRQVDRVRRELGADASVPGLSKTEARVLSGLARSPRGLPSIRAVALKAGVSPTAAGRALDELEKRQLLQRERTYISAGRARPVELLTANVTAPEWSEIAARLARIEPPRREPRRGDQRVPSRLRHLFWNSVPAQLEVDHAGGYIARRLIQTQDLDGLAWGVDNLSPADWLDATEARGLRPEQRTLAENLAAFRS
jgi:DNA-binding Lrp family transcriptional regulator